MDSTPVLSLGSATGTQRTAGRRIIPPSELLSLKYAGISFSSCPTDRKYARPAAHRFYSRAPYKKGLAARLKAYCHIVGTCSSIERSTLSLQNALCPDLVPGQEDSMDGN